MPSSASVRWGCWCSYLPHSHQGEVNKPVDFYPKSRLAERLDHPIHWRNILLIIPAFIFMLTFAVLVTAVLRPPGRPAALLSIYLLSYANIVLVAEITNSFHQLNNPWLWVALHLTLMAAAWAVWMRAGKPSLKAPWYG